MKKLARISDKLWNIGALIAGVTLVAITILIIVNIVARRFFNAPIYGSTEIVKYLALVGGALALSQNEWFDGNIQMTLVLEKISEKAKLVLEIIDYVVCSIAFIFVSYLLVLQTSKKFQINDVTVDLKIPIGIFAGILSFGFMFLTLTLIVKTILKVHQLKTGENLCGRNASAIED